MNAAQLESSLPSSWYRSPEVFRTEKERIFCREWIGICRDEELPKPGDYQVLDVLGERVLPCSVERGFILSARSQSNSTGSVSSS